MGKELTGYSLFKVSGPQLHCTHIGLEMLTDRDDEIELQDAPSITEAGCPLTAVIVLLPAVVAVIAQLAGGG